MSPMLSFTSAIGLAKRITNDLQSRSLKSGWSESILQMAVTAQTLRGKLVEIQSLSGTG